ncbi:MAG: hypothetical protein LBV74_09720 [Tannerella sp.]|jgi:hypothetical protein|nr:hypothetical protein [Tannerella sp.]
MQTKQTFDFNSDALMSILFVFIALFISIIWGILGYYILSFFYFITSFFFYLAIFLSGMLFRVRNLVFIPSMYILIYVSDWISRNIIDVPELQTPLFVFLALYHIELIILSIIKINLDAIDYGWDTKKKLVNKRVALIFPVLFLYIYYFIIKQVFAFD